MQVENVRAEREFLEQEMERVRSERNACKEQMAQVRPLLTIPRAVYDSFELPGSWPPQLLELSRVHRVHTALRTQRGHGIRIQA